MPSKTVSIRLIQWKIKLIYVEIEMKIENIRWVYLLNLFNYESGASQKLEKVETSLTS